MKKLIMYFIPALVAFGQFTHVQAAEVEVKWSNSDKYSDVDAGEEHRQHFKDRTFKAFEKHFVKMAELLPEKQKLVFDMTDIDLAGDVHFGGIKRIRIIKDIFFPSMSFSYQLINADNSVVKSGDVELKDMGFMMHSGLKYRDRALGYEKEMFDDWFKKTFENDMLK
ncbi:MAG: DUF3016 domain-containing protein [Cognaticolwellia sp.]